MSKPTTIGNFSHAELIHFIETAPIEQVSASMHQAKAKNFKVLEGLDFAGQVAVTAEGFQPASGAVVGVDEYGYAQPITLDPLVEGGASFKAQSQPWLADCTDTFQVGSDTMVGTLVHVPHRITINNIHVWLDTGGSVAFGKSGWAIYGSDQNLVAGHATGLDPLVNLGTGVHDQLVTMPMTTAVTLLPGVYYPMMYFHWGGGGAAPIFAAKAGRVKAHSSVAGGPILSPRVAGLFDSPPPSWSAGTLDISGLRIWFAFS